MTNLNVFDFICPRPPCCDGGKRDYNLLYYSTISHRRRVMKKPAKLFRSPALPLLLGGFLLGGSLLGGCYYPYDDQMTLARPVTPVYTDYPAYYGYIWPGYYYSPYYSNSFWWPRTSYYYYNPPRRLDAWRPAPSQYRPDGPHPQGWQNRAGGPSRSNDPGFRSQPANPASRSPGGGQPRSFSPSGPIPRGGWR